MLSTFIRIFTEFVSSTEAVFGSTLSELHQQDKTTIPIFVLQCINHIEKSVENLRSDGLYRISGNAAQIQKIRYEVSFVSNLCFFFSSFICVDTIKAAEVLSSEK